MYADVATELNYMWKINIVGDSYVKPSRLVLKDSPSGPIPLFTILTDNHKITTLWEDGTISL